jgi:hypothetical protein
MYTLLMAFGRLRLGFLTSPAAIYYRYNGTEVDHRGIYKVLTATISVPINEKAACDKTVQKPQNRPSAPAMPSNWTNGPGFFQ